MKTFEKKRAKTLWFRFPSGEIKSFLWKPEDIERRKMEKLSLGAIEIRDPFRKGAPPGGFGLNLNIKKGD